ncbi:hypothetical protein BG006_002895, partial [Podila minutissima]
DTTNNEPPGSPSVGRAHPSQAAPTIAQASMADSSTQGSASNPFLLAVSNGSATPTFKGLTEPKFVFMPTSKFSSPNPRPVSKIRAADLEEEDQASASAKLAFSKKTGTQVKCADVSFCLQSTVELFTSNDDKVKRFTDKFYQHNGPARVVQAWDEKLDSYKLGGYKQNGKKQDNNEWDKLDEAFVNSAVDVVIKWTLEHIKSNEVRKDWWLLHMQVTDHKINGYLFNDFGFLGHYANGAKYLM